MANSEKKVLTIDLPFDDSKHNAVIGQGFNGPFSHQPTNGINLRYSVDFVLDVGTEVTAVQDGIVRRIIRSTDCYRGFDPKLGRRNWATSIEINHPQFTGYNGKIYSMLQHLNPDSIQVSEGQRVTKGQTLACTGLSGFLGPIPHLHLSMVDDGEYPNQTVPFNFRNYDGPLDDDDVATQVYRARMFGTEQAIAIYEAREEAYKFMASKR